ncbi:MAG: helix-turn-helix domain-containing protein [Humibacter sp.]
MSEAYKYPDTFALVHVTGHRDAGSVSRVPSAAAAHIGRLMVERRLELGETQDEVAVNSGIDSSNIRAYESGRAMPNVQSLVRVAVALNLEPGDLLRGLTPDLFAVNDEDGRRRRPR